MELVKNKDMVFIVGAPRSGTSWLHSCLHLHPDIASLEKAELRIFSEYIPPLRKVWEKEKKRNEIDHIKLGLPTIWTDSDFNNFISDFVERVYSRIAVSNPKSKIILDKHPHYSHFIHEILREFPNAKFIHIYRDGRDAIASIVSAQKNLGFGFEKLHDACKNWVESVNSCIRWKQKLPDQFFEIKYEDMLIHPQKILNNVFHFLQIDSSQNLIDNIIASTEVSRKPATRTDVKFAEIRSKGLKVWDEMFSKRELNMISANCDELLLKLGYIDEPKKWTSINIFDRIRFKLFQDK